MNLDEELNGWLALDRHYRHADQGRAACLVRELAVDRERLLRRVHALEETLSDIDEALERESVERLAKKEP